MTNKKIEERMGDKGLSLETIRTAVNELIEMKLAERPSGKRQGARLTTEGRRKTKHIVS